MFHGAVHPAGDFSCDEIKLLPNRAPAAKEEAGTKLEIAGRVVIKQALHQMLDPNVLVPLGYGGY